MSTNSVYVYLSEVHIIIFVYTAIPLFSFWYPILLVYLCFQLLYGSEWRRNTWSGGYKHVYFSLQLYVVVYWHVVVGLLRTPLVLSWCTNSLVSARCHVWLEYLVYRASLISSVLDTTSVIAPVLHHSTLLHQQVSNHPGSLYQGAYILTPPCLYL